MGGVVSPGTARVGLECGYRGWHCAARAGAMALAQRDDADFLRAALPSASKGKGRWNSRVPWAFPVPRVKGRRTVAKQGGASLATSSPCSASAD